MSDTEQENVQEDTGASQQPDEPDAEPETPGEQDAEQEGTEDFEADDDELEIEQPEQPEGLSEKQLEKGLERLEKEATRHANRVSEIMGGDAQVLVPCELCAPNIPGFRFPVAPAADVVDRVREAIGLGATRDYVKATHARECDDCRGHGYVLSGSKVQGMELVKCPRCNANGFISVGGSPVAAAVPATNGSPEVQLPHVDEQPASSDPWGRDPTHPDFGVMPNLVEQRRAVQGVGV